MAISRETPQEKAARIAARRGAASGAVQSEAPSVEAPSVPRTQRSKPIRFTIDLAPSVHADFEDWTKQAARDAGLGRLNRADVMRELVRDLLENPETAARIKRAVYARKDVQ